MIVLFVKKCCPIKEKYGEYARKEQNLNYRISENNPVVYHNLKEYNDHLIT